MDAKTTGYDEDGTIVITFARSLLVYRRGHGPGPPPGPRGLAD
jgi:itaconyl-CoA hydratase